MVGKILSVKVEAGQSVSEDDEMFIMEAMKMEIPVGAPVPGTVKEVKVSDGQSVESEEVLAVIE
jgi:biotin carboxyl carrier protein